MDALLGPHRRLDVRALPQCDTPLDTHQALGGTVKPTLRSSVAVTDWAEALSKISPVVLARSSPPLARRVTGAMKVSGLLRELDR